MTPDDIVLRGIEDLLEAHEHLEAGKPTLALSIVECVMTRVHEDILAEAAPDVAEEFTNLAGSLLLTLTRKARRQATRR